MNWKPIAIVAIGVLVALFIYGCGPEMLCYAQGGEPVANAFGLEWCDADKDGRLSDGDFRLEW